MKLCNRMFPLFSDQGILLKYVSQIIWGEEYKCIPHLFLYLSIKFFCLCKYKLCCLCEQSRILVCNTQLINFCSSKWASLFTFALSFFVDDHVIFCPVSAYCNVITHLTRHNWPLSLLQMTCSLHFTGELKSPSLFFTKCKLLYHRKIKSLYVALSFLFFHLSSLS